jgi:hypothetical protein
MTIPSAPMSLLDSVLSAETNRQDTGVAVLKKAQDAMKQEGAALVQMLEQSVPPPAGGAEPLLDAYA